MTQAQSGFGKQRLVKLTACGKAIPMVVRGKCQCYVIVWHRYTFALFLLETRPVDELIVIPRGHSISAGTPNSLCGVASFVTLRLRSTAVCEHKYLKFHPGPANLDASNFSNAWRATRASTGPQSLIAQKCGPRLGSSVIYNARTWRATLHSGVCCGSPHHRKRLMPALSSRVRNTPRSYFRSVSVPWGHNVTHRIIVDAVRSEVRLPIS